ncbi:MAG: protein translocase subunit SecD [Candidatus Pacebacteria bacterium]|nr:protein translocase subunit SecD [Candidatus Paceibacterota bacterium]
MLKQRIYALGILLLGILIGWNVYSSEMTGKKPFRLGLDLSGGSHLVYRADVSALQQGDVASSMDSLRDVIEDRINAFGVTEPNIITESQSIGVEGTEERLVVELPGVTDISEAIEIIGQTPLLVFKTEVSQAEKDAVQDKISELSQDENLTAEKVLELMKLQDGLYQDTDLTGRYLERAQLQFNQGGQTTGGFQTKPIISISFNKEGADLFEKITKENVGKTLAIYLDGNLISAPVVNTAISGGQAVIEGNFSLDEAKEMVGRLNSGALPIPIELISTTTVGPILGHNAVEAGVQAAMIGFLLISITLILWYRLPGVLATIALAVYVAITLWIFKLIPVTLTSAGIAGFVISLGMAVDANILIFERMKEELAAGESLYEAMTIGFKRAWTSISDTNLLGIITAVFLFWFGTTLIKGFALTFGIGIIVSVFSAVTFSRFLLLSFIKKDKESKTMRFLFKSGFNK